MWSARRRAWFRARPYLTAARRQACSSRSIVVPVGERDRPAPIGVEPVDLAGDGGELVAEGRLVVAVGVGVDVVGRVDREEGEAGGGRGVDVPVVLRWSASAPVIAGPAGLSHARRGRRRMTRAGVRPVRAISRIDCCGKIGSIPGPARRMPRRAPAWPGRAGRRSRSSGGVRGSRAVVIGRGLRGGRLGGTSRSSATPRRPGRGRGGPRPRR